MVAIDLIEALQKQMILCKEISRYSCGVFVNSKKHMDIVRDVLSNIIERPNRDISLQVGSIPEAKWRNGSILKIITSNGNTRGRRFSGLIIDNEIDKEIIDYQIMPMIVIPYNFKTGKDDKYIKTTMNKVDIFTVSISQDDVEKSKQYKQVYISTGCRSNSLFIDGFAFMNNKLFKKEYECMWIGNEYNTAIRTIEKDNNKILIFNALGIPKENIEYKTEFVNKSKESYLVIQGSVELTDLNYENGINVRMKIDTDIYDGYDVCIENGLIFVRLHEIINEAPVLKDYGVV